ncbi:opioid growth factor receptor conserved region-domain-containing protein [Hypoxylon trugodes]|uniref:opioid growth factor receptor conserved region-domain-containing protein n=1 Tax=Hypoxylon trugodes TaxID=326681 RepID=UPI00218DC7E1|nr:opioid growth factor receptor conserved region-domain-containing protein [Hypoxylon trugodes]KAI1382822.1 opioid growth factor receptor conserved region-domain-containing protein [Hypoxylon trugodes]
MAQNKQLQTLKLFYHPFNAGEDYKGRRFDTILGWSDDELEKTHDYIQWLFPLAEESRAVKNSPVVDVDTIRWFRQSGTVPNMILALKRMLWFYGFEIRWSEDTTEVEVEVEPKIKIEPKEAFTNGTGRKIFHRWLKPHDHNHARITRILRSLRLFGFYAEALAVNQAFQTYAQTYPGVAKAVVNKASRDIWEQVATYALSAWGHNGLKEFDLEDGFTFTQ